MDLPPFVIAVFLKPFMLLFLMVVVVYPIKTLVWRFMRDGKLKRALFTRIGPD